MTLGSWAVRATAGFALVVGLPCVAAAQQEAVLKGGVAVSRLAGSDFWDDNLVTTSFGGGVRFRLGMITLQPEIHVVTKGATPSTPSLPELEDQQLRLEYIELPVFLVLPARFGDLEVFAMGGPTLMLESRCRYVERRDGLRTNFPCEEFDPVFGRHAFDWGATAAAGVSHRLGAGRLGLEARHTWGLRNVNDNDALGQFRNRTFAVMLGYSIGWAGGDDGM